MSLPRTALVQSAEDVQAFGESADFPCLLKPLHFREWQGLPDKHPLVGKKVAIAGTVTVLLEHWRAAAAAGRTAIVQEIIRGPDTMKRVYVACYDGSGKRTGHAIFRELRCDPLGFGPATVSEPVEDPDAEAIADGWLRRMGYAGPGEGEMKRDGRDGR